MAELISPMRLAKKLNVKPQIIYGYIRQGRLTKHEKDGKIYVDPEEAIKLLASPRRVGRPSTDEVLKGFQVKRGEVLTWVVEVQKQVAVVEKERDEIVMMRKFLNRDKFENHMTPFRKVSLANHIKNGTITRDDNWNVLEAIAYSWDLSGQQQLAASLRDWLEENRRDANGTEPDAEEAKGSNNPQS